MILNDRTDKYFNCIDNMLIKVLIYFIPLSVMLILEFLSWWR